jgi:hypothetical protein
MKRKTVLVPVVALLMLVCSQQCWAAQAQEGSPEEVVAKAMEAVNHGRIDEFVKAMEPASLEEVRKSIVASVDEGVKRVGEAKVLQSFPGVKSAKALKALDGPRLFAGVIQRLTADPDMKKSLAETKIDVFGHVDEGDNTAHVIYRSTVKLGDDGIERLNVATLRKNGQTWKMVIPDEFAGPMRRGAPGNPALNLADTEVEPLGHVLDGTTSALILYRSTTPVGDSKLTKLAVMALAARDPAFEAVKANDMAAVKALLENRLGFRTAAEAPVKKAGTKKSPARPRSVTKAMPRTARTAPKSKTRKTQQPEASEPAADLPEGLVDLPATFRGGDRDRFHDIAPSGGVLIGARVSYIMRFGGPKISSIQPIYRVEKRQVNGKRWGGLLGKETTAVAKPGYAVGAINTHTGLTVDGFEMVFMKIDGDRLDPEGSYKSPWLGDEKGGSPSDVSSNGKVPVGLQGRAGKEVFGLGLIVAEEK